MVQGWGWGGVSQEAGEGGSLVEPGCLGQERSPHCGFEFYPS